MSSEIDERVGERDYLLERLQNLRGVLPVFAQELASSRRQAARLRLENARLTERVRELQREGAQVTHSRLAAGGRGVPRHTASPRSRPVQ